MATKTNDLTIRLAGEAGQGVESGGAGFSKALSRGGLWLHTYTEYMSRIRGGLNFFQIRVADHPLWAHTEGVHLLLAFSPEAATDYGDHVVPGGALLAKSAPPPAEFSLPYHSSCRHSHPHRSWPDVQKKPLIFPRINTRNIDSGRIE